MSTDPKAAVYAVVHSIMSAGSSKDGCNDLWRNEQPMYHLSKAQAHLATHIKQRYDARGADGENHLKLAIARLAMALCQEMDNGK